MTDNKKDIRSGCSVTSAPVPGETSCKQCGTAVEMWSDETEVKCENCSALVIQGD
jgi:Zn finger protein HypA/HybF involved in hydrogenase expression